MKQTLILSLLLGWSITLDTLEYTHEMYLVQGLLCLEISLICATFVTMEPALEGEKATQRRAFKILWNLVATDFKPVCISAVPVLANSVTSVPLRQAAGLGDAALLFGPDLDSASRTILSGCRRVPSNLPETDCLLKQVWHVQEPNL